MTEVVVEHDGEDERYTADIVVLACGAANTAKLLLVSASDKHPNGLANGSDQVGRNYMFHNSQAVLALSREENPTIFQKTLGLNDFYLGERRVRLPAREHPDGRQVAGARCTAARSRARRSSRPSGRSSASRSTRSTSGSRPRTCRRPENRVTVDRDGKLTLAYAPTNEVPKEKLLGKLESILGKLDLNEGHLLKRFAYMKNEIPVAGVAHQAGTCRFGTDPATSVLDVDCRAHELDNLYVVDTSVFPSIGAVNPALTAMANSLRVGDHLLERLGVGDTRGRGPANVVTRRDRRNRSLR